MTFSDRLRFPSNYLITMCMTRWDEEMAAVETWRAIRQDGLGSDVAMDLKGMFQDECAIYILDACQDILD